MQKPNNLKNMTQIKNLNTSYIAINKKQNYYPDSLLNCVLMNLFYKNYKMRSSVVNNLNFYK